MSGENQWHVIVDGEDGRRQEGPVSTADLEAMLSAGEISTDTLVWRDGMTDWEQIGALPDFSHPAVQDVSPGVAELNPAEPATTDQPEAAAAEPEGPSDTVLLKDTGNHTIQYSRSRSVLMIVTNDYHAGPLELTKLDLLGFLTAMESAG